MLAYCEHVAAPRQAGLAAAHAFQQLRAHLVDAGGDETAINLDALLLRSTRRAAAARGIHAMAPVAATNGAAPAEPAPCHGLETDLVAQIEQPAPDVRAQLEAHLKTCPACKRAMERLESGQRAFDKPPRAPLPARIAEQLIAALVAAAPVKACNGNADVVRQQAWNQLGNGAAAAPAFNGAALASPMAQHGDTTAGLAGSASAARPPFLADPVGALSTAGPAVATRRRPARSESGSLHALVSDAFEVSRHRLLGARPGSVERPRQSAIPVARWRARFGSGHVPLRPSERKRVELAAIGLFVAVATAVTLVTFMMASSPSDPTPSTPSSGSPAATPDPVEPLPDISEEPAIEPEPAPPAEQPKSKPKSSGSTSSKPKSSAEARDDA